MDIKTYVVVVVVVVVVFVVVIDVVVVVVVIDVVVVVAGIVTPFHRYIILVSFVFRSLRFSQYFFIKVELIVNGRK